MNQTINTKYKDIKKVYQITHNDLDGVGCRVMANHIFGKENVHTIHCHYDTVDEQVKGFIGNYIQDGKVLAECPFDLFLITDIYIKFETGLLLNYFAQMMDTKVVLIDHHATGMSLGVFDWARVHDNNTGFKKSGTSMMWDEFLNFKNCNHDLLGFRNMVDAYDTWSWKENNTEIAKQLNDLLYIIGIEPFVLRFTENVRVEFTQTELALLGAEKVREYDYIIKKEEQMRKIEVDGMNFGLVYAEQYHSILGNILSAKHDHLHGIMIIDVGANKVSFRTVRDDVDLGRIVKKRYGGGGHAKAAGCALDDLMLIAQIHENLI